MKIDVAAAGDVLQEVDHLLQLKLLQRDLSTVHGEELCCLELIDSRQVRAQCLVVAIS